LEFAMNTPDAPSPHDGELLPKEWVYATPVEWDGNIWEVFDIGYRDELLGTDRWGNNTGIRGELQQYPTNRALAVLYEDGNGEYTTVPIDAIRSQFEDFVPPVEASLSVQAEGLEFAMNTPEALKFGAPVTWQDSDWIVVDIGYRDYFLGSNWADHPEIATDLRAHTTNSVLAILQDTRFGVNVLVPFDDIRSQLFDPRPTQASLRTQAEGLQYEEHESFGSFLKQLKEYQVWLTASGYTLYVRNPKIVAFELFQVRRSFEGRYISNVSPDEVHSVTIASGQLVDEWEPFVERGFHSVIVYSESMTLLSNDYRVDGERIERARKEKKTITAEALPEMQSDIYVGQTRWTGSRDNHRKYTVLAVGTPEELLDSGLVPEGDTRDVLFRSHEEPETRRRSMVLMVSDRDEVIVLSMNGAFHLTSSTPKTAESALKTEAEGLDVVEETSPESANISLYDMHDFARALYKIGFTNLGGRDFHNTDPVEALMQFRVMMNPTTKEVVRVANWDHGVHVNAQTDCAYDVLDFPRQLEEYAAEAGEHTMDTFDMTPRQLVRKLSVRKPDADLLRDFMDSYAPYSEYDLTIRGLMCNLWDRVGPYMALGKPRRAVGSLVAVAEGLDIMNAGSFVGKTIEGPGTYTWQSLVVDQGPGRMMADKWAHAFPTYPRATERMRAVDDEEVLILLDEDDENEERKYGWMPAASMTNGKWRVVEPRTRTRTRTAEALNVMSLPCVQGDHIRRNSTASVQYVLGSGAGRAMGDLWGQRFVNEGYSRAKFVMQKAEVVIVVEDEDGDVTWMDGEDFVRDGYEVLPKQPRRVRRRRTTAEALEVFESPRDVNIGDTVTFVDGTDVFYRVVDILNPEDVRTDILQSRSWVEDAQPRMVEGVRDTLLAGVRCYILYCTHSTATFRDADTYAYNTEPNMVMLKKVPARPVQAEALTDLTTYPVHVGEKWYIRPSYHEGQWVQPGMYREISVRDVGDPYEIAQRWEGSVPPRYFTAMKKQREPVVILRMLNGDLGWSALPLFLEKFSREEQHTPGIDDDPPAEEGVQHTAEALDYDLLSAPGTELYLKRFPADEWTYTVVDIADTPEQFKQIMRAYLAKHTNVAATLTVDGVAAKMTEPLVIIRRNSGVPYLIYETIAQLHAQYAPVDTQGRATTAEALDTFNPKYLWRTNNSYVYEVLAQGTLAELYAQYGQSRAEFCFMVDAGGQVQYGSHLMQHSQVLQDYGGHQGYLAEHAGDRDVYIQHPNREFYIFVDSAVIPEYYNWVEEDAIQRNILSTTAEALEGLGVSVEPGQYRRYVDPELTMTVHIYEVGLVRNLRKKYIIPKNSRPEYTLQPDDLVCVFTDAEQDSWGNPQKHMTSASEMESLTYIVDPPSGRQTQAELLDELRDGPARVGSMVYMRIDPKMVYRVVAVVHSIQEYREVLRKYKAAHPGAGVQVWSDLLKNNVSIVLLHRVVEGQVGYLTYEPLHQFAQGYAEVPPTSELRTTAEGLSYVEKRRYTPPLRVGERVVVSEGSGLASGKHGEVRSGRESQDAGKLRYISMGWVYVRFDDGDGDFLPRTRLTRETPTEAEQRYGSWRTVAEGLDVITFPKYPVGMTFPDANDDQVVYKVLDAGDGPMIARKWGDKFTHPGAKGAIANEVLPVYIIQGPGGISWLTEDDLENLGIQPPVSAALTAQAEGLDTFTNPEWEIGGQFKLKFQQGVLVYRIEQVAPMQQFRARAPGARVSFLHSNEPPTTVAYLLRAISEDEDYSLYMLVGTRRSLEHWLEQWHATYFTPAEERYGASMVVEAEGLDIFTTPELGKVRHWTTLDVLDRKSMAFQVEFVGTPAEVLDWCLMQGVPLHAWNLDHVQKKVLAGDTNPLCAIRYTKSTSSSTLNIACYPVEEVLQTSEEVPTKGLSAQAEGLDIMQYHFWDYLWKGKPHSLSFRPYAVQECKPSELSLEDDSLRFTEDARRVMVSKDSPLYIIEDVSPYAWPARTRWVETMMGFVLKFEEWPSENGKAQHVVAPEFIDVIAADPLKYLRHEDELSSTAEALENFIDVERDFLTYPPEKGDIIIGPMDMRYTVLDSGTPDEIIRKWATQFRAQNANAAVNAINERGGQLVIIARPDGLPEDNTSVVWLNFFDQARAVHTQDGRTHYMRPPHMSALAGRTVEAEALSDLGGDIQVGSVWEIPREYRRSQVHFKGKWRPGYWRFWVREVTTLSALMAQNDNTTDSRDIRSHTYDYETTMGRRRERVPFEEVTKRWPSDIHYVYNQELLQGKGQDSMVVIFDVVPSSRRIRVMPYGGRWMMAEHFRQDLEYVGQASTMEEAVDLPSPSDLDSLGAVGGLHAEAEGLEAWLEPSMLHYLWKSKIYGIESPRLVKKLVASECDQVGGYEWTQASAHELEVNPHGELYAVYTMRWTPDQQEFPRLLTLRELMSEVQPYPMGSMRREHLERMPDSIRSEFHIHPEWMAAWEQAPGDYLTWEELPGMNATAEGLLAIPDADYEGIIIGEPRKWLHAPYQATETPFSVEDVGTWEDFQERKVFDNLLHGDNYPWFNTGEVLCLIKYQGLLHFPYSLSTLADVREKSLPVSQIQVTAEALNTPMVTVGDIYQWERYTDVFYVVRGTGSFRDLRTEFPDALSLAGETPDEQGVIVESLLASDPTVRGTLSKIPLASLVRHGQYLGRIEQVLPREQRRAELLDDMDKDAPPAGSPFQVGTMTRMGGSFFPIVDYGPLWVMEARYGPENLALSDQGMRRPQAPDLVYISRSPQEGLYFIDTQKTLEADLASGVLTIVPPDEEDGALRTTAEGLEIMQGPPVGGMHLTWKDAKQFAQALFDAGFTATLSLEPAVSLFEQGVLMNPQTMEFVFAEVRGHYEYNPTELRCRFVHLSVEDILTLVRRVARRESGLFEEELNMRTAEVIEELRAELLGPNPLGLLMMVFRAIPNAPHTTFNTTLGALVSTLWSRVRPFMVIGSVRTAEALTELAQPDQLRLEPEGWVYDVVDHGTLYDVWHRHSLERPKFNVKLYSGPGDFVRFDVMETPEVVVQYKNVQGVLLSHAYDKRPTGEQDTRMKDTRFFLFVDNRCLTDEYVPAWSDVRGREASGSWRTAGLLATSEGLDAFQEPPEFNSETRVTRENLEEFARALYKVGFTGTLEGESPEASLLQGGALVDLSQRRVVFLTNWDFASLQPTLSLVGATYERSMGALAGYVDQNIQDSGVGDEADEERQYILRTYFGGRTREEIQETFVGGSGDEVMELVGGWLSFVHNYLNDGQKWYEQNNNLADVIEELWPEIGQYMPHFQTPRSATAVLRSTSEGLGYMENAHQGLPEDYIMSWEDADNFARALYAIGFTALEEDTDDDPVRSLYVAGALMNPTTREVIVCEPQEDRDDADYDGPTFVQCSMTTMPLEDMEREVREFDGGAFESDLGMTTRDVLQELRRSSVPPQNPLPFLLEVVDCMDAFARSDYQMHLGELLADLWPRVKHLMELHPGKDVRRESSLRVRAEGLEEYGTIFVEGAHFMDGGSLDWNRLEEVGQYKDMMIAFHNPVWGLHTPTLFTPETPVWAYYSFGDKETYVDTEATLMEFLARGQIVFGDPRGPKPSVQPLWRTAELVDDPVLKYHPGEKYYAKALQDFIHILDTGTFEEMRRAHPEVYVSPTLDKHQQLYIVAKCGPQVFLSTVLALEKGLGMMNTVGARGYGEQFFITPEGEIVDAPEGHPYVAPSLLWSRYHEKVAEIEEGLEGYEEIALLLLKGWARVWNNHEDGEMGIESSTGFKGGVKDAIIELAAQYPHTLFILEDRKLVFFRGQGSELLDRDVLGSLVEHSTRKYPFLAAAIKLPDGRVYTGDWHAEAYRAFMEEEGLDFPEGYPEMPDALLNHPEYSEGFITNQGQYVTREEAAEIMRLPADQAEVGTLRNLGLMEEDPLPEGYRRTHASMGYSAFNVHLAASGLFKAPAFEIEGATYTGTTHSDATMAYLRRVDPEFDSLPELEQWRVIDEVMERGIDGFITNDDQFVTREEAARMLNVDYAESIEMRGRGEFGDPLKGTAALRIMASGLFEAPAFLVNGDLYTGYTHADAIEGFVRDVNPEFDRLAPDQREYEIDSFRNLGTEGYVLKGGQKFVTREEAAKMINVDYAESFDMRDMGHLDDSQEATSSMHAVAEGLEFMESDPTEEDPLGIIGQTYLYEDADRYVVIAFGNLKDMVNMEGALRVAFPEEGHKNWADMKVYVVATLARHYPYQWVTPEKLSGEIFRGTIKFDYDLHATAEGLNDMSEAIMVIHGEPYIRGGVLPHHGYRVFDAGSLEDMHAKYMTPSKPWRIGLMLEPLRFSKDGVTEEDLAQHGQDWVYVLSYVNFDGSPSEDGLGSLLFVGVEAFSRSFRDLRSPDQLQPLPQREY
jgi:hypothetical protein